MKPDDLYKAYKQASEKSDAAAQKEAEAKLKQVKTRIAADKAAQEYETAFDLYCSASMAATEAYNAWVVAHNAAQKGGA